MMTALILFAQPVKKGPNTTVVQCNTKEYHYGIKGTHKDKMACVIYPLKTKWKHGNVLPYSGFSSFS